MILLDTNVISELMRLNPDPTMTGWVKRQARRTLFSSSIVQAEIQHGIALMPAGRRRESLAALAHAIFDDELAGRVLPFDQAAALRFADVRATRHRAGRPIDGFDALIAATALAHGAAVATRDTGGFDGLGLEVINPWDA